MALKWGAFRPSTPNWEIIMKHYLVLKNCMAGGARRTAGDVVELPASEGNLLISMGRVEEASAPKPEPKIEDRSVGLSEDTAPKKRGRPRKNAAPSE